MLSYFLPVLLLLPFTLSASLAVFPATDHHLLPRASNVNSPICADGKELDLEVLSPLVKEECVHMWSWKLHDRTNAYFRRDCFYRPTLLYPAYFRGHRGCEFSVEHASVHHEGLRFTNDISIFVDAQIAMVFHQLLMQCVDYSYGGIYLYESTFKNQLVKFAVHVGNHQKPHASGNQVTYI